MKPKANYLDIIAHYETCLEKYGDTHKGVDWPNLEDALKRYQVMANVFTSYNQNSTVLDFGCGTGHFYEYLRTNNYELKYSGLDISEKFISVARKKLPAVDFICVDILKDGMIEKNFDYIILNGVFTEKRELTFEEMWNYTQEILKLVFRNATIGIAFNTMSIHVDWERPDLFHLPMDLLAKFIKSELSKHFCFHQEYGLFEYTSYVYKEPIKKS